MAQTPFLILAAIAVASAFGVIFNKNVLHSALLLLANFGVLAVFYFILNAQFVAVAQILIYAGAIIALFLFVIILLGAEFDETISSWLTIRNVFLPGLGLVLLTVIGTAVFEYPIRGARGDFTPEAVAEFGQVEMIGAILFTDYVLAFQLIAVLLLVGVIGIVWLARPQKKVKSLEKVND